MKQRLYIIILTILLPMTIFSMGTTEESDFKEAKGLENWEHSVDINEKEPGKYNLLIRAKDKANNETYSGPFDIIIDPESDLPLVSITNPASFMRVGGVLNIVGTARDDDAIQSVLLKINDGEFFEAKGQEFWSFTLDADVLKDGQHTITAKAVDINGLEGHEVSVIYNQDTIKPVNSVENYSNGVVFSGKINIHGKVVDLNGISKLEVSSDNQFSYNPVKFEKDKEEDFYTFDLDIDTHKLSDGPNIYWFKSEDKTGSVGYTAFLFFVDNLGPETEIIDPILTDKLNGRVTISGTISDVIGVKSFKYRYGEDEYQIPLLPGNPYWSQTVDLLNESRKEGEITFISEDTSGNIAELEYIIPLDKASDKPVLTLTSPKEGVKYKETLIIDGYITDDDYVDGVIISVDGEEAYFTKTFNGFTNTIKGLKSGSHRLEITPRDSDGVLGDTTEINFEIDSFLPKILINSIEKDGSESLFYPGVEVTTDGNYKILGSVSSGNPLTSLSYKLDDGDFIDIKWSGGSTDLTSLFFIDVDSTFNYGALNLTLRATDSYGNNIEEKSLINVKNYGKINDDWGVYSPTPENINFQKVSKNSPYTLFFHGPNIDSVELSPKSSILEVNFKKNVVSITPREDGLTEPTKVVVKSKKGVFESKAIKFISDTKKPSIAIDEGDYLVSNKIKISGSVEDIFLDRLEYRLSTEREYGSIKFRGTPGSYSFDLDLSIGDILDESVSLEILATDRVGNKSSITKAYKLLNNNYIQELTDEEIRNNSGKGSDRPVLYLNYPYGNQLIYTNPVLSGFTRDDDSIKSLIITDTSDGGKSKEFSISELFNIELSRFGSGKKTLNIVSVDKNGTKSSVKKISYNYVDKSSTINLKRVIESNGRSDYKTGSLISNEENVKIEGVVAGFKNGDISYSFNERNYKSTVADGSFIIDIPNDLKWGRNHISVLFTDIHGRESKLNSFFYIVDKNPNRVSSDDTGIYFNDSRIDNEFVNLSNNNPVVGLFKGRDIRSVEIESKKGATEDFIRVKSREKRVILSASKPGISDFIRVVVTTIDGDTYKSDYMKFINDDIDPLIEIFTKDNSFIEESLLLKGQVSDNLKLSTLKYSKDLGISWDLLELSIDPLSSKLIFEKRLDYTIRPDGGYTILLRAEDLNGNLAEEKLNFVKDNTIPEVELFIPGVDEINGQISIIGKARDNIELESITYSEDGENFIEVGNKGVFSFLYDFGKSELFPELFLIRARDKSGNIKDIFPEFNINQEKDKPVVQIQTPADNEVIRNDFIISGMAFDDDGIESIYYSLDGGEYVEVAKGSNNFSLNIPLESVTNNDHLISVKAVDILGVESDIMTSTFWVSKEEPVSHLIYPKIEYTKKGSITISGTSFDENGIDRVLVSTDNGVSYQRATGTEDWTYEFNTKNIKDGTYSVFVKSFDKLETKGFYSTLINIDNTSPELIINEPYDGDILSDKIVFSGRSLDNIGLKEVKYKIYSHTPFSGTKIMVEEGVISSGGIFNIDIPLDDYEIGDYNIELIAYDLAENRSISTRNFTVTDSEHAGDLDFLFPLAGSTETSIFEVSGRVLGRKPVDSVECYIDDILFSSIKVNEFNYFNLNIDTLKLSEGEHTIRLKATLPDGQVYETKSRNFFVKNSGAWVNIINMKTGDNISGRPFISGEAGFIQADNTPKENIVKPIKVEVSLDNGQIFELAKGKSQWEYRVESWEHHDGLIPVIVRGTFSNGEIFTSRIVVNIDGTSPEVDILEDLEDGRFNESIGISGIASDKNGLTDISVILREGDKSKYEVPGLFQGMFIDVESGFNKVFGGGIGLTFFDDNVKLQFTIGETRAGSDTARIKGMYYGGKLLANIYTMEFGNLLGPDWDIFSMSLGIGASFTQKTITIGDSDERMWFSSIISQLELAKFKLKSKYFNSASIYAEYEATLLSAENAGGFKSHIGIGTRVTLF